MWNGLVWRRIGTSGEHLWMRQWTFGFHKMLGGPRVAAQLVASWVVLSSIEFVSTRDVGFETVAAVVSNVAVFWGITQCSPYMIRRFGRTVSPHLQGQESAKQETRVTVLFCPCFKFWTFCIIGRFEPEGATVRVWAFRGVKCPWNGWVRAAFMRRPVNTCPLFILMFTMLVSGIHIYWTRRSLGKSSSPRPPILTIILMSFFLKHC
jgi:hypothetical protein